MYRNLPRWKSLALGAIATVLLICAALAPSQALRAQTTFYTFGRSGVNDGGTVIVDNAAGWLTFGHFLIGGYTYGPNGDSTFIMEVDANGTVFNTAIFKLSDFGASDRLTDLRFDSQGDLIGCGYNQGAPNDRNGWYFKMPATLGGFIWQHRIMPTSANEVYQPFCILEVFDNMGLPQDYNLSGARLDLAAAIEDPWLTSVNIATGAMLGISNHKFMVPVNQPDKFVNMLEFNNLLVGLGDVDYAMGVPVNGFIRPAITPVDDVTHVVVPPGAHSYLAGLATTPEIHATDHVGFNNVYISTGYGFMKYNVFNWNTFWLLRTINVTQPDLFNPVHDEYDFPFVQEERAEEVILMPGTTDAIVLVEGRDPTLGRDIYLTSVSTQNATPNWARRFGSSSFDEYLFHGSQSQLAWINGELFFIGIRFDGTSEEALLVRVASSPAIVESCVDTVWVVNDTLELDSLFKWQEPNEGIFELPQAEVPLTVPLPESIVCSSCPIATDPAYTTITTGVAAGNYTTWPFKVYIPGGTVITVNGTLDITQSDVVFGPCARIDVAPGGHLRANNSTFRPCDELETWDGIWFLEDATGQSTGSGVLNACVFKNMLNGIFVNPSPLSGTKAPFDIRLTDNSFINCFMSVQVRIATMNDAITGNRFTVDERGIDFLPTGCSSLPPYNPANPFMIGIYSDQSTFEGGIQQNSFINGYDRGNVIRYEGIVFLNVEEANITLNTFTNNWFSITMVRCNNIAVENNLVEVTQQYHANESQIIFDRSHLIWVDGNRLINSVENYSTGALTSAIYTEDSYFFQIKENTIDGFVAGIQAIRVQDTSQITENRISNVNLAGIWVEEGQHLRVTCNYIKARRHEPSPTVGIRYQTPADVPPVAMRFRGNCIFNCTNAMVFINPGVACIPTPTIRNNFLYNYTNGGMVFTQFSGDVGLSNAVAAASGHNTFTSNNFIPGAVDIINTTPPPLCLIVEAGNWGILAVSAGVTNLSVVDNFHSMADCGMQIDNQPVQEWLPEEQCDRWRDNLLVLIPNIAAGGYGHFDGAMQDVGEPGFARMALGLVIKDYGIDVARPFYEHLMSGSLLNTSDKAQVRYEWLLANEDWTAALAQLPTLNGSKPSSDLMTEIEALRLTLLKDGRSWKQMTPAERQQLENMEQSSDVNADVARAILNEVSGTRPYIPEPIVMPDMPAPTKSLVNTTFQDHMEIFPNPSGDLVSVKFAFESASPPLLRVTDLMGRIVYEEAMAFAAGTHKIDIHSYSPGAYVVSIQGAPGHKLHQVLLKQ